MFCPDCGTDVGDDSNYCWCCGYPADALRIVLEKEQAASIGWAERIISKQPETDKDSENSGKIYTFVDVKDPEPEETDDDSRLVCETCRIKVGYGSICENCGDKLPTLSENDNFFSAVIGKFFRFITAPAHFARTLEYPLKGGIVQALLIPGILCGVYILSLPATQFFFDVRKYQGFHPVGLAFIGMTVYIIVVPVILLVTAAHNHWVAMLLGGRAPFRRAIRVTASGLTILMSISLIINLIAIILYSIDQETFRPLFMSFRSGNGIFPDAKRIVVFSIVFIGAWYHAWLMSGLYRLNWWKTIVHTFAAYIAFTWWIWLLVLFGIPALVAR